MDRKERWEITWTVVSIVLLAAALIGTLPQVFTVGGDPTVFNNIPSGTTNVVQANITAMQYVFEVQERGPVNSQLILPTGQKLDYYYNLMVVPYDGWINATMYAVLGKTATENLYIPTYNAKYVVDTQIVPGLVQYATWGAVDGNGNPIAPGVYAFLSGEYAGPWYSYYVGEIIVLPKGTYYTSSDIASYESMMQSVMNGLSLQGDPYNPPYIDLTSTMNPHLYLVADNYDAFNSSVPGPTAIVKAGSNVTVTMTIPTPNNDHNYLLNYTASGQPYVVNDVYVGIYAVYPNGTIVPVAYQQIQYDKPMTFTFKAEGAPVYLYGIVYPVFNVYNIDGMSGKLAGEDMGMLMSLWGAILVEEG